MGGKPRVAPRPKAADLKQKKARVDWKWKYMMLKKAIRRGCHHDIYRGTGRVWRCPVCGKPRGPRR